MKSGLNKVDSFISKIKNNRYFYLVIAFGIIIIALGIFINSLDSIINFWNKYVSKDPVIIEIKDPYIYKTIIGSDIKREYYPIYNFRFSIINDSEKSVARNCFLMLTSVMHMKDGQFIEEQNFEPVRLAWDNQYRHNINGSTQFSTATSTELALDNQYPNDINPKSEIPLLFARIAHPDYQVKYESDEFSGDPTKPQFRFSVKNYPRWMSSHMPPGKHRFTIAVHCEGGSPIEQAFELEWSGKWSDDFELMLKEIRIKKMKNTNSA